MKLILFFFHLVSASSCQFPRKPFPCPRPPRSTNTRLLPVRENFLCRQVFKVSVDAHFLCYKKKLLKIPRQVFIKDERENKREIVETFHFTFIFFLIFFFLRRKSLSVQKLLSERASADLSSGEKVKGGSVACISN